MLAEVRFDDANEHLHPHWQASGTGEELVGLHLFLADDDVVDRGDAAVGTLFELDGDALGEGLRIDLAISTLDQKLRAFPQLARELAGQRVFDDGAALWTRGVARDT